MANNSSGTVDISVYVTLDKEDDRNILSFIVQDEYHLKKLAVGAYNLNILDTQIISRFYESTQHIVVACGDYVVVFNFNQYKNLNVILFNIKPTVLKKSNCIFKIIFFNTDKMNNIDTKPGRISSSPSKISRSSSTKSLSSEQQQSQTTESLLSSPVKRSLTENSLLFKETFTAKPEDSDDNHQSSSNEEAEEDETNDISEEIGGSRSSTSSNETHQNGNSTFYRSTRGNEIEKENENDGELASKRQKLGN